MTKNKLSIFIIEVAQGGSYDISLSAQEAKLWENKKQKRL